MRHSDLPSSDTSTTEQSHLLVGEAFGTHVADAIEDEQLGVMVESPPQFTPSAMVETLNEESPYTIGLAIVGIEETELEALSSVSEDTNIRITDELSTAIKWRNGTETGFEWGSETVPDRIVVFVRGDPPKLGSLHRLSSIPLGRVRQTLCQLMAARPDFSGNKPSQAVWDALAESIDANIDIRSIAMYAVSCLKSSRQESIDALGEELDVLGLFIDSQLLENPSDVAGRLAKNAELINRTIHITNRDRKRLINSIKTADRDQDDQAEFIDRLRRFQRTSDDSLLEELEFDRVRDAFSTTSQRVSATKSTDDGDGLSGSSGTSGDSDGRGRSQYSRRTDDANVGVELAFDGQDEELGTLAREFDDEIRNGIEKNEKTLEFDYDDDSKIQIDVYSDLSHFLDTFLTIDRFGGVVRGGDSREEVITDFTTLETDYFTVDDPDGSFQKLRSFAERSEEFQSVVDAFDLYLQSREKLVDSIPSLVHSPMIRLLGDEELLEASQTYLKNYQQVQKKLDNKYRALQDASAKGARLLLSDFLLLDTILIDTNNGQELMLSPLHPLHLWKHVRLAEEVLENKSNFSEDDKKFLEETVEEQPHVLTNLTVGGGRLVHDETYFIQSAEEATLPVYTESNRAEPGDNGYLWDYLTNKFTAAYPPAKQHLKITVVDPIEPHQLLTSIVSAADSGDLGGATVEFAYVDSEQKNILSGTTSAEEEDIINLFGPEGEMDDFTILTWECADYDGLGDHLSDNQRHMVVVNDQSAFFIEEFERDMNTSINPLYVPKEYNYDAFEDEINISASTEGRLFSEYQDLINQRKNQRNKLHNAGVHELNLDQEVVDGLEEQAIWTCVSAPSMNSNPFWEEDLISKERRGDRDYAIYSDDIDLFTRTLQRILNEYPIAPDKADIQRIASRIANTERSGLLRLITEETIGSQHSRNSKGLLGAIIAVHWIEETYEDPKLVFSIDDPRTRNWLNFGDSNRRADFIVLQPDEQGGLEMEIVEVKSLDEPDQAFQVTEEGGDHVVRGRAADQLKETTETIRGLFEGEDNVTTPPRREALREQLYYELIGRDVPGEKNEWVERVNNVFRGDEQLNVAARIASVEINNQTASGSTIDCVTDDMQTIRVTRLPKKTIVRLIMNGTDSVETGGTSDDESDEKGSDDGPEEVSSSDTDDTSELAENTEDGDTTEPESIAESTNTGSTGSFGDPEEYADQVESLKRVLGDFDIKISDIDANEVEVGPNLVRYKVELASGQKQGPLENRSEDIAREMALEREPYVHRLPGTKYVAVDVPRKETDIVLIQDYLGDLPDRGNLTLSGLPFIAGVEPAGNSYIVSLDKAPHMLVGGTTGSGKTVFLYSILTCLLETFDPDELRLAIVDPKLTNFMFCNQLPNLEHDRVITESENAAALFEWITEEEIPRRTKVLGESGSIDIEDHNERSGDPLLPLVVIIDEYADLIDGLGDDSDDFETNVRRIAQKARSVGIHLIISTQRPSANIIDTDLRANLDMRVAFRLPSASDSQVILDESGAEGLGGNGDMLFKETDSMTRLQGTLVEPDYLRNVIDDVSE